MINSIEGGRSHEKICIDNCSDCVAGPGGRDYGRSSLRFRVLRQGLRWRVRLLLWRRLWGLLRTYAVLGIWLRLWLRLRLRRLLGQREERQMGKVLALPFAFG